MDNGKPRNKWWTMGGGGNKQFDDELLEMFDSDRKEFE